MESWIPQSRFSSILKSGNKVCILSATEEGVTLGRGTSFTESLPWSGSFFIFADRLTLRNEKDEKGEYSDVIQFGGSCNLFIAVRELDERSKTLDVINGSVASKNTPSSVARSRWVMSCNGKPGTDFTATSGGNAGTVSIYVDELIKRDATRLGIAAIGGPGAIPDNPNQPAGTGGKGGAVSVIARPSVERIRRLVVDFLRKWAVPASWTDAQVSRAKKIASSHPLHGDLVNIVSVINRDSNEDSAVLTDLLQPLVDLITNNDAIKLHTILDVANTCYQVIDGVDAAIDAMERRIYAAANVNAGAGGRSSIKDPESRGIAGKQGSVGSKSISLKLESWPTPTYLVCHPLQCNMMLSKIKAYFQFDDAVSRRKALQVADKLLGRLAFIPRRDAAPDSIKKAFQPFYDQADILGLPNGTNIEAYMHDLQDVVQRLYLQLYSNTTDLYGMRSDWAPRLSVSTFKSATDEALNYLEKIETSYSALQQAQKRNQLNRDTVLAQRQNANDGLANLQKTQQDLMDKLHALQISIKSPAATEEIRQAGEDVRMALTDVKDKIMSTFKLDIGSVLKAVEMVAFSPKAFMLAVEGASVLYEGWTKIPNDRGVPVDKDLLVGKMTRSSGNLQDIITTAGVPSNDSASATTFTPDLKREKLLLVEQDDLKRALEDFTGAGFAGEGQRATEKMNHFVDLVVARNEAMAMYNFTLKTILDNQQQVDKLNALFAAVTPQAIESGQLSEVGDSAMALASTLLDQSRTRTMRLLSFMQRAIEFSTLAARGTMSMVGPKGPSDQDLEMTAAYLREWESKLNDVLLDLLDRSGADATPFPADYANGQGKTIRLTPDQLKELLKNNRVDIVPEPVYKDTTGNSQFRGCADIRIYRVRCYLEGLQLKTLGPAGAAGSTSNRSALVKISVKHNGDSTFIATDDTPHKFTHAPINPPWSYNLFSDGKTVPIDSGDMVNYGATQSRDSIKYAGPGLFAKWTIGLGDLVTENFDLSGVTGCYLEFAGASRSFL